MQADYANRVTADGQELQRAKDREAVQPGPGKQGAFAELLFLQSVQFVWTPWNRASLMARLNGSHCDVGARLP